jgi:nucleoside-diphosphate-sugar epimerase
MNIVVTGSSGLIGGKLTATFGKLGHHVVGIDRSNGHDLSSMGDWERQFAHADVVVHLAATADPTASIEDVQRNNIVSMGNVAQACIIHRVPRLVFASSTHVALGQYGYPAGKDAPESFYGLSKMFGEHLVRVYTEKTGQSSASVRIGWVPTAEQLQQQTDLWLQSVQVSDEALAAAFFAAAFDPFRGYRLIECVGAASDQDDGADRRRAHDRPAGRAARNVSSSNRVRSSSTR